MNIPFNVPYNSPKIFESINLFLQSNHFHGNGKFTEKSIELLKKIDSVGDLILTPSCTSSLEIASHLLELEPNDEVILPDFTFTSAAIAVTKFKSIPIFVDIDKENKCIDVEQIEKAITDRTRAISWVNYAGATPDLNYLKKIALKYDLILIEDNAHSLGVNDTGKTGDIVVQSFHATKNIQCGEGGSIKLNSRNSNFVNQVHQIQEKGTNRKEFLKGNIEKYEWVSEGGSYLLPEICAYILSQHLEDFSEIQQKRRFIYKQYIDKLGPILDEYKLIWSNKPSQLDAAHIFFIEFKTEEQSNLFLKLAHQKGIQLSKHYQSLSHSKYGVKHNLNKHKVPNSRKTSANLVRLPVYPRLGDDIDLVASELEFVLKSLKNILIK